MFPAQLLGSRVTLQQFGLRQSPVFVGEVVRYPEVVHYVAPPFEDIVEMPDEQIDRVIRSVQANQGQLSNVLHDEMPILAHPKICDAMVQVITDSFKN